MTAPADPGLHGWLVIDKPEGITSARVVAQIKRATGVKTGHAGTLDPLATGVLPLALGEATKTVRFAAAGHKRYRFTVRWGIARDTGDREGAVTAESSIRPDSAAITAIVPRFTGMVLQRPPAFSAIKIGGRRAYALARAGHPPEMLERSIERAPISARSRAILPLRSARSGMSWSCAGSRSAASPKNKRFRWIRLWRLGIVSPLPGICCRSRPCWTTSRLWP